MKISWIGHSCFLLETDKGIKIVTDPYESGSYSGAVGYSPVNIQADIVTVSHYHADHGHTKEFKTAQIVDREGSVKVKDIEIKGLMSYHDDKKGDLRGKIIIFVIKAEGLKIVHFGDLGTQDVDADELKDIDIALIPVGGTFTLDAEEAIEVLDKINPKITIPMHFKTPKLGFGIDGVDVFLTGQDYEKKDILEVNSQNINSFKKIVVLNHQR
ncbi:MAG: MBL fold metallo-hydrolase [Omnitrophica bacterium]|nr:MBL fold metallo-hydrolase [Candidatus Omnitrophota bacterium]